MNGADAVSSISSASNGLDADNRCGSRNTTTDQHLNTTDEAIPLLTFAKQHSLDISKDEENKGHDPYTPEESDLVGSSDKVRNQRQQTTKEIASRNGNCRDVGPACLGS